MTLRRFFTTIGIAALVVVLALALYYGPTILAVLYIAKYGSQ